MEKYLIKKQPEPVQSSTSVLPQHGVSNDTIYHNNNNSQTNSFEYEPPEKRRKLVERKYMRNFRGKWKEEFEWLEKDENNRPHCRICHVDLKGSGFHLRRHSESNLHRKKMAAAKVTPNLQKFTESNNEEIKTYYLIKEAELKMVSYICNNNLAFRIADTMPQLFADMFPDSQVAKGLKLKRKKATQLAVNVLAPYTFKSLADKLRNIQFSIMIDETTDISTKKCLVIIVRFWEDNKVRDRFFKLLEVDDGTSHGIFNILIKCVFKDNQIPISNLIGFGADNAAVMMGSLSGLKAKLKSISPNIFVMGCTCHSLHLCASHAAKKIPPRIEQLARSIYSYFSHSSNRMKELEECQIFAAEKPQKLLYPSQTRWLSLKTVVGRILDHWNSLIIFFQRASLEDNVLAATDILADLRNNSNKLYFQFLSYILDTTVTKMNLEFQAESPKLPFLLDHISALYKTILKCFIKNEVLQKNIFYKVSLTDPSNYRCLEDIYCGANVDLAIKNYTSISSAEIKSFKVKALDFYIELCLQIKKRFDFGDNYLMYASNFTPEKAISGAILSIADFKTLYPETDIDMEALNSEWQLLPELDCVKSLERNDILEFCVAISKIKNSLDFQMFPNLTRVVRYIFSLPHSSAACERAFSQLSLVKTNIRNRLLIPTCESIMYIKDEFKNAGYNFRTLGKNKVQLEGDVIEEDIFV